MDCKAHPASMLHPEPPVSVPFPKNMTRVQTYPMFAADGRRLRRSSQSSIERLEDLKLVVVQRTRRGAIVCAHFYGQTRMPIQSRFNAGTKYSYREAVGNGHVWTLKALPWQAVNAQLEHLAEPEVVDSHVRAMFQSVSLSIATEPVNRKRTDNVISIGAGRKVQKTQPVSVTGIPLAA